MLLEAATLIRRRGLAFSRSKRRKQTGNLHRCLPPRPRPVSSGDAGLVIPDRIWSFAQGSNGVVPSNRVHWIEFDAQALTCFGHRRGVRGDTDFAISEAFRDRKSPALGE